MRPHIFNRTTSASLPACRVELVDEPADVVAPLLEGYREALQAAAEAAGSSSPGRGSLWDSAAASGDGEGRQQAQVRGGAGFARSACCCPALMHRNDRNVGAGHGEPGETSGWADPALLLALFPRGAAAVAVDADAARRQRPVAWRGARVSGNPCRAQQHGHEAHSCQPEVTLYCVVTVPSFVKVEHADRPCQAIASSGIGLGCARRAL